MLLLDSHSPLINGLLSFTWGQTRVVVGEGKSKKIVSSEDEVFDESSLVKRSFTSLFMQPFDTCTSADEML